ncbi:PDDEXK nuclease domain-containing protein [Sphingobacterium faecium]|uniref:PDDEXK nuclease domain-containing protein n=1 Tax=Sphingobacterium faecium TaxID=34087 RepID=UPI002469055C|nr:PDDEXK nuclease domain-containing protein [Sphingobacterium faecium]MDH5828718.1 PDDEXK nuclease domain-containing protein [Sphingobacterium faecium]
MEIMPYQALFNDIKTAIRNAQIRATLAVNSEMILLYWETGKMIAERQSQEGWSAKVIPRLSKDLKNEFSDLNGYSERNLGRMLSFFKEYSDKSILPQLVAKLPWGHNILLIEKIKDLNIRIWYIQQCIESQWTRQVLESQLKNQLYERQGKAVTNFQNTLPSEVSTLAQETIKDPYIFDFLSLDTLYRERDIENQLVQHVSKFLLELGKGFAFVGQQYKLKVAENDYYLDLLFYHTRLKCYVVIELKNNKFIPEYTGKLNFYLSAVDSLIKMPDDNPTIGLLLCKEKNSIEAEFALRDMTKPIGVSEYIITENLPENLKSSLPTIEEIENELKISSDINS